MGRPRTRQTAITRSKAMTRPLRLRCASPVTAWPNAMCSRRALARRPSGAWSSGASITGSTPPETKPAGICSSPLPSKVASVPDWLHSRRFLPKATVSALASPEVLAPRCHFGDRLASIPAENCCSLGLA